MKRVLFLVLLAAFVAGSSLALTISNSRLELTLHEQNGRFSLYAVAENGRKTSLLVEDDPRTTILTVLAGSKIYRMGDSFEFRQTVSGEGETAAFAWTSSSLVITQTFNLDGATLTMNIQVENVSEQDLRIGIRYLLDTYLGEKSEHFTADGLPVKTETDYVWATPYEIISSDGENNRLVILTTGSDITEPDRIVLANWKRLNDSSWDFEANQTRDFSLLPYSINDSAVALYYEPQSVPSKTSRSVSLKMKWEDPSAVIPTSQSGGTTRGSDESEELREDIRDEMIKIDSLIIRIDTLINSDDPPDASDIEEITSSLDELEERKEELTGQQQ